MEIKVYVKNYLTDNVKHRKSTKNLNSESQRECQKLFWGVC